jgi:hypothetical protein
MSMVATHEDVRGIVFPTLHTRRVAVVVEQRPQYNLIFRVLEEGWEISQVSCDIAKYENVK